MAHKVSIVIEKDEHGYYAYSPELEGRHTQGDSLEETIQNAREAVASRAPQIAILNKPSSGRPKKKKGYQRRARLTVVISLSAASTVNPSFLQTASIFSFSVSTSP